MKTREEAVRYGLTFPEVYRDEPFHDPNWTVLPAYHLNKKHWNSIILDGSVPEEKIQQMIGESYDLVEG